MDPLNFPHLDSYINDFSGVLNNEKKESLNIPFRDHETKTTEQAVTILFPHKQGHELLEIGLKVFNENGIGQKNLNNGLLLIVATEEKKIRIVVGKGLELKYTEMRCRDIIENHLRPLLNDGKYEEMIKVWGNIISKTEEIGTQESRKDMSESFLSGNGFYLTLGVFLFLLATPIIGGISPIVGNIIASTLILLIGIGITLGGIYFFRTNQTESEGVKILASLIICGTGLFFVFGSLQGIICNFKNSGSCTEWNFLHTPSSSYNGGSSSSDYPSDWGRSSSSSFGGGGGSSNGGGGGD